MRDIKFRGKRVDNGEWIYGDLLYTRSCIDTITDCVIADNFELFSDIDVNGYEVDPATVGQFTGLLDKNGKEIYEGDIILRKGKTAEVVFDGSEFALKFPDHKSIQHGLLCECWKNDTEVIGNIHTTTPN